MKSAYLLILISSVGLAAPAFADLTANYVAGNGAITMKIEIGSNGNVRGATSNPNMYFVARDGRSYVVQASFNGPAVMRVEDMATVMAEQMKKMMAKMPADAAKHAPGFDIVKGGEVTIRGRRGVAYYIGKQATRREAGPPFIVISDDPKLAPLAVAMRHQFEMSLGMAGSIFGGTNPFKSVQDALATGAPLVFTGMELDEISANPIPEDRFALPGQPLTLEAVRKNLGALPQ